MQLRENEEKLIKIVMKTEKEVAGLKDELNYVTPQMQLHMKSLVLEYCAKNPEEEQKQVWKQANKHCDSYTYHKITQDNYIKFCEYFNAKPIVAVKSKQVNKLANLNYDEMFKVPDYVDFDYLMSGKTNIDKFCKAIAESGYDVAPFAAEIVTMRYFLNEMPHTFMKLKQFNKTVDDCERNFKSVGKTHTKHKLETFRV